MAASERTLGEIHEALAVYFVGLLRTSATIMANKDATIEEKMFARIPAPEQSVMVAFLKNNSITAAKSKSNAIGELEQLLQGGSGKPTEAEIEAAMSSIDFSQRMN